MARYDFEVRKTIDETPTVLYTEHLKDVASGTHAAAMATELAERFMTATGETGCTGAAVPQE